MQWVRELGYCVFMDEELGGLAVDGLSDSKLEDSGINEAITEMSELQETSGILASWGEGVDSTKAHTLEMRPAS